ncbi:MAG TPA: cbb3-type cytochrome c oxidase N-terminal domain-containing protein [Bacteroidota bacterium]|nr:cbb3-type cytochrome c oxidase N-terminal domain-containing protein [Bacteroidota bacterium]
MTTTGILLLVSASGMETALLITGLLTVVAVLVVLISLILPAEDRRAMAASFGQLRRYLLTGSTRPASELDHDFDGIRELDSRVPPWFTAFFLATILFAAIYMLDYHVFKSSKLMLAEYEDEVAAAEVQRRVALAAEGTIDEDALVVLTDAAALKRGGEEYKKYCVSCHGNSGEGIVGPNLTDQYWIHGGSIKNVYATIKNGVPAKGMISWQLVLSPKQMQEISSYVLSLQGTAPINGKKPEGALYGPSDTTLVQQVSTSFLGPVRKTQ